MIINIREAFKDNVKTLTWMDKKTKKRVEDKAAAMKDQVGYPDYIYNETRFRNKYKNLSIVNNNLFLNRLNIIKFAHNRMLNKIRKKVDKTEWPMDPQTINAMYSFNENGMIIPAGILQQPFFHGMHMSTAMLYGAIGAILGHELTHGFDNTGRKFNRHGELGKQWWTNSSLIAFKNRSQCMVDQYSGYKVRGEYPINGKLTLGENIADNGGFKTALRAYHDKLLRTRSDQVIDGLDFSNEQLFHLAFAQAYCSNSRPNEQYLATLNDRHSEEEFRVIGTLSNSKEFSNAFNCPEGSRMNPSQKCSVWVNEHEAR
jgi:predicted metalloendopeptidase